MLSRSRLVLVSAILGGTLLLLFMALIFVGPVASQGGGDAQLEGEKAVAAESNPGTAGPVTVYNNNADGPLFVGVDDVTIDAYRVDPATSLATPVFNGAEVWGAAYDPGNDIVWFNDGTVLWEWPVGGVPTMTGTIVQTGTATSLSFVGLAFYDGVLYGTRNVGGDSGEGIYTIDPVSLGATLVATYTVGSAGLDLGGFAADPATGKFYGTNDDSSPLGRGLVEIDLLGNPTVIAPYPAGQTDIDGLAFGDNKAFLVTDQPGFIYVYDFDVMTYTAPITNPWTTSEIFSAGAWIPDAGPIIDVDPVFIGSTQPWNMTTDHLLTISNLGDADLNWNIIEGSAVAGGPPAGQQTAVAGPGANPSVETIANAVAGGQSAAVPASIPNFMPNGAVLYDNGPLITCSNCGAGGAPISMLQSTSLGMNTLGFGHQVSAGNRIADDFTVTSPWTVDEIVFYAYQTNSSTTSPITAVNFQIWDGPPNDPLSNVVFGDTSTNRMTTTVWSGIYRVSETTQTDTNRPIMANTVDVGGLVLAPGTYWLDWQADGSASFSGPWAPPVTVLGSTGTGNAMQSIAGVWGAVLDSGTSTPQDFPFLVIGSGGCDGNDVPWASAAPTAGTTIPAGSDTVTVTFDSTGMMPGLYTGQLCVESDDPINPSVPVGLELIVDATPALVLTKTVGLDPGSCATTDAITIPAGGGGTNVTYCYTMSNTGNMTLTYHTVIDDQLGILLGPDFTASVGPGASVWFTATTLITQTTVNSATWTITERPGGNVIASGSDTATVTRGTPTGVGLSAFGGDGRTAVLPTLLLVVGLVLALALALPRRKVA